MRNNSDLKTAVIFSLVFSICAIISVASKDYDPGFTHHYTKNGASAAVQMDRGINVYHITFVPTVANGGTYDISSLGLTAILSHKVSIQKTTGISAATDIANISTRSLTTSTYTFDIVQGSASVVTLLTVSVLQGPAQIYSTPLTNLIVHLEISGY